MYKDKHKTSYLNSTRAVFAGEGGFDIPIIEPTKIEESNFIGFNEAMSSKQTDCGVHFFSMITNLSAYGIIPTGT